MNRRRIVVRQPTLFADADEVAELAKGMTDGMLMCRKYQHAKVPQNARWVPDMNYFELTLMCTHLCGVTWTQTETLGGDILNTEIHYPDGYLLPTGTGRMDADGRKRVRVEMMRRRVSSGDVEGMSGTTRKARTRKRKDEE